MQATSQAALVQSTLSRSSLPRAVNPWRRRPPKPLVVARLELRRFSRISKKAIASLQAYIKGHPTDPRPYLLLGHAFTKAGWRQDAIRRYERAFALDASSRGDPQMLQNLIAMVKLRDSNPKARRTIVTVHGLEALRILDLELRRTKGSEQNAIREAREALLAQSNQGSRQS